MDFSKVVMLCAVILSTVLVASAGQGGSASGFSLRARPLAPVRVNAPAAVTDAPREVSAGCAPESDRQTAQGTPVHERTAQGGSPPETSAQ